MLDDLHVAAADPAVDRLVAELVDRAPERVRWVIATRSLGALPVASWLAYGTTELPVDEFDLRFTLEEAVAMARSLAIAMRDDDLRELLDLTGGWPTAFVFALRAATRSTQFRQIAAGTRDMIYRYLAEQVFRTLLPEEQQFLRDTCVTATVDLGTLAFDHGPDALARIEQLRAKTAFISVEGPRTYKYHDLFREFLEHELKACGGDRYDLSVRRSAESRERAGKADEALLLYVQVCATYAIERVLSQSGFALLERGCVDLVESALAALPPAIRERDARMLCLRATTNGVRGRHQDSDVLYSIALERAGDVEEKVDIAQRFAMSLSGRLEHGRAADILESVSSLHLNSPELKAKYASTLAVSRAIRNDLVSAERLAKEALDIVARLGDEGLRAMTLHCAAIVSTLAGSIAQAGTRATEAVQIAERLGLYGLAARASTTLIYVANQAGDTALRQWTANRVLRLSERAADRSTWYLGLIDLYDLAAEQGDLGRLEQLDAQLRAVQGGASERRTNEALLPAFALQSAWQGNFSTSLRFLDGTAGLLETPARRALRHAEIALFAAASGERDVAEAALRQLAFECANVPAGETHTPRFVKVRCLAVLAWLMLDRGSVANRALRRLEVESQAYGPPIRALCRACRAAYVHVESGADHAVLLEALSELHRRDMGGYARLIESLPLPKSSSQPSLASLTKAEMRVLRILATGASSKDAAAELGRSAQTVDSHVKAIVRKLGCKGRHEAVSLARRSGIV